jgi:hypothetical protein
MRASLAFVLAAILCGCPFRDDNEPRSGPAQVSSIDVGSPISSQSVGSSVSKEVPSIGASAPAQSSKGSEPIVTRAALMAIDLVLPPPSQGTLSPNLVIEPVDHVWDETILFTGPEASVSAVVSAIRLGRRDELGRQRIRDVQGRRIEYPMAFVRLPPDPRFGSRRTELRLQVEVLGLPTDVTTTGAVKKFWARSRE